MWLILEISMKFNQRVYNLTKKVPKGKVTTYKIIAGKLNTKAYRAVGNALNKNMSKSIPCHRVVKSNSHVGGFRSGTSKKVKILREEGIRINKKNKIIELKKFLLRF